MASELSARLQFVYSKLSGDATLRALGTPALGYRIFPRKAPQDAQYPLVIFRNITGSDEHVVGDDILWQFGPLDVEVIGERDQDYDDIDAIAERIKVLLHQISWTPIGGRLIERIYREFSLDLDYDTERGEYPRRIQRFQFIVQ